MFCAIIHPKYLVYMVENSQPVKNKGGRPKGRRNQRTIGRLMGISDIFTDAMEREGWNKLLSTEDPTIFFRTFQLALSYKRGLPKQEFKHSGAIGLAMTEADRAAAIAIIAKMKGNEDGDTSS